MHNYVRTDPTLYGTQKFGFKVVTNRIETEFSRGLTNSAEYTNVIIYTQSKMIYAQIPKHKIFWESISPNINFFILPRIVSPNADKTGRVCVKRCWFQRLIYRHFLHKGALHNLGSSFLKKQFIQFSFRQNYNIIRSKFEDIV